MTSPDCFDCNPLPLHLSPPPSQLPLLLSARGLAGSVAASSRANARHARAAGSAATPCPPPRRRETAQALLGRLALEACAFRTRLSCMPRRASPSRHRYRRRVRHGRQQLRQQARSARSAATRPRRRSVRAQIGPNRPTNRLRTPSPSSNGVVETGGLPSSLALGASGLAIEVIFTRTSPCLSRKPLLYIFD
jgi:hypothetical protein